MKLLVSRDDDQLLTDIEGFEYELLKGEIIDCDMEWISQKAFEYASSQYNLPAIFIDAVLETCRHMGLLHENVIPINKCGLPRVHGDGHGHYIEWNDMIRYLSSDYGLDLNLSAKEVEQFEMIFDECIDGNCQYSDLIDNAMLDMAIELGFVRRTEDEEDCDVA